MEGWQTTIISHNNDGFDEIEYLLSSSIIDVTIRECSIEKPPLRLAMEVSLLGELFMYLL